MPPLGQVGTGRRAGLGTDEILTLQGLIAKYCTRCYSGTLKLPVIYHFEVAIAEWTVYMTQVIYLSTHTVLLAKLTKV